MQLGESAGSAYLHALEERFACKRYNPDKQVTDEDFAKILEAARLSMSSFGFEPWKLLVLDSPEVYAGILERAWGAKKNASKTVVVLARKQVNAESDYITHIMSDIKCLDSEQLEARRDAFAKFQAHDFKLDTDEKRLEWTKRQCYIVLSNMLSMAAMLKVDATPVEGFDADALNTYLVEKGAFDPQEYEIAVLAQFGYASDDHMPHPKTRRALDECISYIK